MAKVYVFFADGLEEIEALTSVDLLRRAGVEVQSVSITGNKLITGAHGIQIYADILFEDHLNDADMVVLPGGGPGTQMLMEHAGLKSLLLRYNEEDKYLAAICAAPGVLGIHGILNGKKAVCYPGCEENLHGAVLTNQAVVVDGKIITSKGPGTSVDFALTLIASLCGKEKSEQVRKGLQYER